MSTTVVLAADVGGTKTILASYDPTEQGLRPRRQHRYNSHEWTCFDQMLADFRQREFSAERPMQVASACFAVAGPVQQGQAQLTNLDWHIDQKQLSRSLGTSAVEVINDIAVLIHGLPHLQPAMAVELQAGEPQAGGTVAVLGLGTGVGMAMGICTPAGLCSCPSEGGHQEFSPCTPREWQLKQWLLDDLCLERLSLERVVSGTGLGHVGRWLLSTHPAPHPLKDQLSDPTADLAAQVAAAAAQGDGLAQEALDLWTGACGTAAANLLLTSLCTGGLWLAGGVSAKQLPQLRSPVFLQRVQQVGRLQPLAAKVPIHALIAPEAGLFAAAQRACQLAHGLAGTPSTSAGQGCGPWGNMDSDF